MTSPLQQKLKITGPTAITANRLADGVVVWFTRAHGWSLDIADAAVATTAEDALALLNAANADEINAVGAYAARVSIENGRAQPFNLRERIRVGGPTIPFEAAA
ncbi:MAG: hypothetical protein B7Y84_15090 [Azorhizobium sp. 32-67-21]|nr:MAG: hypothetical protein B7Z30_04950 [Rhizobiales bacterium 12-68-15]OYX85723.1 MAG: hypothetical protein B7Y84_15090 [Azorhizobium sp. 32-67-21]OYY13897.1 MAG: hypothetical protein B7Y70_00495 [Rhizobiales bacterium 35-68-8]